MAMRKRRRLQDAYRFPGFQPLATAHGVFGDPQVRIVLLVRRPYRHGSASRQRGAQEVVGLGPDGVHEQEP